MVDYIALILFTIVLVVMALGAILVKAAECTKNHRLYLLKRLEEDDYVDSVEVFGDFEKISFGQHAWQLVTFRNPWMKYSAASRRLVGIKS